MPEKNDPRFRNKPLDLCDQICLYAQNEQGLNNLNRISSIYWKNMQTANTTHGFLTLNELKNHNEGLIALSGGNKSIFTNLFRSNEREFADTLVTKYKEIFSNNRYYLEISRQKLWMM